MSSVKTYRIGLIILAGITVGAAAITYFSYLKRRRRQNDDADEGIGDVDSIISEGEAEEAAMAQIPTGTRVSTSNEKVNETEMNTPSDSQTTSSQEGNVTREGDLIVTVSDHGLKSVKVLVLGLDRCGKTSMLNLLASKTNNNVPYQTTTGFNAVQIGRNEFELNIVEVGGNKTTRSYWKNFTDDSNLLVFLVDGADSSRYDEAKSVLKSLLDDAGFKKMSCLLVSNKQDLEQSCKIDEIFDDNDLKEVAKKGIASITLLNITCVEEEGGTSYKEAIMDVIIDLVRQRN